MSRENWCLTLLSPLKALGWCESHPTGQSTPAMSHSFDQECLPGSVFSLTQTQHPGRQQGTRPIRGSFGTPMELGDPFPSYIQHHKPLKRSWPSHETRFLPLDLSFPKVSFGKNAIKSSVILSKWLREEGKIKCPPLLFSPSLPKGHPNRKPFRRVAWINKFNIQLNKKLNQHLAKALSSCRRSFNSMTVVAKSTRSTKSDVMMLTPMAPGFWVFTQSRMAGRFLHRVKFGEKRKQTVEFRKTPPEMEIKHFC